MQKQKVVVCDHIHEDGLNLLKNDPAIEMVFAADIDKVALLDIVADADVAITRSSTEVNDTFIEAVKGRLKAIVRAGVGVDNVNIDGCSKEGIIVMNVPTANTIAAVELTMTHMLSCMRMFPYSHDHLKNQRIWKREKWYGYEMKDKKLGVIGFGNIGSRVGIRAKAFEMDVVAYDPYINPSKATDLGIDYTTNFQDILDCDIITIHTPKNKETINMIDEAEIAKMKDGVVLINCARGDLYNEKALEAGLKSGKVRFAGMDVFSSEPATNHPLLDLDNICVSPHLGANTFESQKKIATQAAENAIQAAKGIAYPNAFNLPIDENKIPAFVKPYLELGQKLAFLAAQANKGPLESIQVIGEGEIAQYLKSMATFMTVGALTESMGEKINYVNADFIAEENGIKVDLVENPNSSAYKNKIGIKLTTPNGTIRIFGTVFEETQQRIVEFNDFALDVEPKGRMILFRNSDVRGVIGEVGTILAEHKVNISDFRLGRDNKGQALALILVDDEVSSDTLKELESLEACTKLSYATL